MWPRKQKPVVPDDTGEAQVIQAEAARELADLEAQAYEVDSLARKLRRRREVNHFGSELAVTFRPRGRHT